MLGCKNRTTRGDRQLKTSHGKYISFSTIFRHDIRNHFMCQEILALNGLGGMDEFFEKGEPRMKGFSKIAERFSLCPQTVNRTWRSAIWIERQRYKAYESITFNFMVKNLYD